MKIPQELMDEASREGVTIAENGNRLIFSGAGEQRELVISRLNKFLDDGLDKVVTNHVRNAIKYANYVNGLPVAGSWFALYEERRMA